MTTYNFKLNDRVEKIKTGKHGSVVGFSRCSYEVFVLYDNDKYATFENPVDLKKVKKR